MAGTQDIIRFQIVGYGATNLGPYCTLVLFPVRDGAKMRTVDRLGSILECCFKDNNIEKSFSNSFKISHCKISNPSMSRDFCWILVRKGATGNNRIASRHFTISSPCIWKSIAALFKENGSISLYQWYFVIKIASSDLSLFWPTVRKFFLRSLEQFI